MKVWGSLFCIMFSTLLLSRCLMAISPPGPKLYETFTTADLNGDGKKETIKLTPDKKESWKFTLTINRASITGMIGDAVAGFYLVDIDTKDKHKEVAVYTPGPSDDFEYAYYWYDGKTIVHMGTLGRIPKYLGNGDVVVRDWMGYWEMIDLYRLDRKTHLLQQIPQQFHYMGESATVTDPLTLYQTQDTQKIFMVVPKGEKVTLLLTSGKWLLVKTAANLLGWMPCQVSYPNLTGLPGAD